MIFPTYNWGMISSPNKSLLNNQLYTLNDGYIPRGLFFMDLTFPCSPHENDTQVGKLCEINFFHLFEAIGTNIWGCFTPWN